MPRFAANLTMLFNELEFLARFEAAARAGFRGVEYLFPYPFPRERLAEELSKHQLAQVLHGLVHRPIGRGPTVENDGLGVVAFLGAGQSLRNGSNAPHPIIGIAA